jgi:flagellar assembly protein FliH
MSSRVAAENETLLAQPVRWPSLRVVATPEAPPDQTAELRQALSEAVEQADVLRGRIEELEAALESKERLGYERGLAEGRNLGRQEANEQQKPVVERMLRAITDMATLRPRLRMESEAGLVRLSVAIAHRVLKRELHLDPLAMEGIVKAALSRVGSAEVFKVRLHPRQAEAVRAHFSKLGVPESVAIEPVAAMDEGDLMIETSAGTIDASINTQITEVERGITARLGN